MVVFEMDTGAEQVSGLFRGGFAEKRLLMAQRGKLCLESSSGGKADSAGGEWRLQGGR